MAPTSLATVLRTHADSMESEGWYTIANRMVEAAKALEYAEILRSSVLSNIGHIEKAAEHPGAGSELPIEMACSKLREAAVAFERRNKILADVPDDHTFTPAQGQRLNCPQCGALLWHYPDGRETCSRCEYEEALASQPPAAPVETSTSPLTRHLRMIADGLDDAHKAESVRHAADLLDAQRPRSSAATAAEALTYILSAIESFQGDPPDNQFQKGYLAALEVIRDEAFTASPVSRPESK